MLCPLCETDNPDNAVECSGCGKTLRNASSVPDFAPPIAGLEHTLQEQVDAPVEEVAGLEPTMVASPDLSVPDLRLEMDSGRSATEQLDVERTAVEEDPQAPQTWTAGTIDLETGRETDLDPPTPKAPETAACPWCGHASQGAVCDRCGQRKARYSVPAEDRAGPAAPGDLIVCPNCFARVMPGPRCAECGVPFPALA
jgi:ribosomal protein L32